MNALNTAAALTVNTVALASTLATRPLTYTPTVYVAPVSSYYSPSVVVKLNINQQCSSNVGCQTGCCKYDNFYLSKTCQTSSSCNISNLYVKVSGGGAGGAAGGGVGAFICCILIFIWCKCKCSGG